MVGAREHGNGISGSIQHEEFFELLTDHQLINNS
jgi:hypothetical protein